MREVEGKLLDIDVKNFISKLENLGAKKIFDDVLEAFIFDTENFDLLNNLELLRVRSDSKKNILCFKQGIQKENIKDFEELEVSFDDLETMKLIIKKLGFQSSDCIKKHRISYKYGGIRIEIDKYLEKYDYIPVFAEVESDDEEKIFEFLKRINFKKEDLSSMIFSDLIKRYKTN